MAEFNAPLSRVEIANGIQRESRMLFRPSQSALPASLRCRPSSLPTQEVDRVAAVVMIDGIVGEFGIAEPVNEFERPSE